MGNSDARNNSTDGMVVFGFGRGPGTSPLLKSNHKFIVGFTEIESQSSTEEIHISVMRYINSLLMHELLVY